jgi:hypothetical protein
MLPPHHKANVLVPHHALEAVMCEPPNGPEFLERQVHPDLGLSGRLGVLTRLAAVVPSGSAHLMAQPPQADA